MNRNDSARYYCSMHCERDKTYDKPGNCPVCGMHLKKLETVHKTEIIYTCPMYQEVKSDKPGLCPKCGMTLLPKKGNDTNEGKKAYKEMTQKFWIALALSIPVPILIVVMSGYIPLLGSC